MRVLWFSPTSSLYEQKIRGHNGGGWISALERELQCVENLKLAIAFDYMVETEARIIDNTYYYPIYIKHSKLSSRESRRSTLLSKATEIISQFKPDVIQLFGSESWYGLLTNYTDIPIVVHMQGSLPSYYNARYPVGISVWNRIFSFKTTLMQKIMAHRCDRTFRYNALQEEKTLKANKYFVGRTHWDRAIVEFYNPDALYFHCEEMIRTSFMESDEHWKYRNDGKIRIISTISSPLYKGVDVVLKTARLLKEVAKVNFEWNIYGISESDFVESCYGIKAMDVNVNYQGVVSSEILTAKLLESTIYVHPSYIDNSPNSVCEAQLLGVPVIAVNVGGLATIVKDGITGYLVPANDPVMLASYIVNANNEASLTTLSLNERNVAHNRHNPQTIINKLLSIYRSII